ncbi:type II toxin-antitoxin system Phd/YefM family antitoxin [Sphingomonas citri]|jgi:prevent-host-death family protein|uniref:Antitoxin n=1 Tax=Sphingomonas citri TaxID=2862499 RepID=A0ABS7BUY4_9SPHN|nr:type II toxin-antitoxin system Phd/YefM family antitoxin [Sphingomonas citri]MBW6533239.1 type II toxin-antitoxin system Phd/YefM family antitoxin [Sphingomonas citri]
MRTLSSRAFNQDVSHAKRVAAQEPVLITDRGRPTHVLLSFESFRQLAGQGDTLADQLAAPEPVTVEPDWRAITRWSR